ncbi:MAG: LA_2272 family surface repeat-containing protein [Kiritimatiellia bacterium]
MKKILSIVVCACACAAAAQHRETVMPGDPGLKREAPPAPLLPQHPDVPQAPIVRYSSPVALNFFGLSVPSVEGSLDVRGFRLNLSVPFATANHRQVLGFDLGFSGETVEHVGGIAVNLCDNWSASLSGAAIALVNVTDELHGLQIGLVNRAGTGRGIQIGLWNQSDNFQCPIVGVVW